MESLKQEAINAISKMPDSADIDEIMYRLYVIDKVKKGRDAIERGETVAIEELKKEIESW
jgi:predicted transcriptional regulator